jgi:hypothetical protein
MDWQQTLAHGALGIVVCTHSKINLAATSVIVDTAIAITNKLYDCFDIFFEKGYTVDRCNCDHAHLTVQETS